MAESCFLIIIKELTMLRKRSYSEWEQERLKYRKDLIFFDLSTMVPADFHAGLREKEEEYRKIQEKEQENPNRIHKFIDYFDPLAQHFYHTYLQNPLFKRFMEFLGAVRNRKVEVCLMTSLGLSENETAVLKECFSECISSDICSKITRLIDTSSRSEMVKAVREVIEVKDQISLDNIARYRKEDPDFEFDYGEKPGYVIISKNSYNREFPDKCCVYSDQKEVVADMYLHRAFSMLFHHNSLMGSVPEDDIEHTPYHNQKIIFLDIDGVLNHDGYDENGEREYINKGMVKHLGYIVRKTGAKIVLSSSWRGLVSNFVRGYEDNKPGIKLLFKYFRQENLVISSLTPGTCRMMGGYTRPLEIRTWLAKYHDIDSFVILDDETFWCWGFLKFNVVTTTTQAVTPEEKALLKITTPYSSDTMFGLTRELADRAIEILMRKAPYCKKD